MVCFGLRRTGPRQAWMCPSEATFRKQLLRWSLLVASYRLAGKRHMKQFHFQADLQIEQQAKMLSPATIYSRPIGSDPPSRKTGQTGSRLAGNQGKPGKSCFSDVRSLAPMGTFGCYTLPLLIANRHFQAKTCKLLRTPFLLCNFISELDSHLN